MKNVIKLLSMMLIAGTVMVSCTEKPDNPEHQTPKYTITVTANNDAYGTVSGGGIYDSAATATLTATANEGYRFVNWADGNSNNPRIITVTADGSYMANFEELAGVNVTFGDASWTAQYTNTQYLYNGSLGAILVAASQTSSTNQYPIVQLVNIWQGSAPSTGTYTGSHTFNGGVGREGAYLYYFENQSMTLRYDDGDTETIGDWWDETMTLNITALDADAMTISLVANANMVNALPLGQGTATSFDGCPHRSLTLNVINQSMTEMNLKSNLNINKGIAKIAR
ncbi:MAG: hypothetical protein IJ785_07295 [Bacteroidales bacterium]|nr:hypothetical protein [Bacteroidales bacterium]